MVALYGVSALIALFDEEHERHDSITSWFVANTEEGWASCPLTQNGYLRIRSQLNYPHPLSLAEAYAQLLEATSTQYHQFINDDISILDYALIDARHLSGNLQLTDAYLLALAVAHDARLVTLGHAHPTHHRPWSDGRAPGGALAPPQYFHSGSRFFRKAVMPS